MMIDGVAVLLMLALTVRMISTVALTLGLSLLLALVLLLCERMCATALADIEIELVLLSV